ncbi:MAG: VWA domain-containing protein, partial [Acidimicrobiia bacterium]
VGTPSQIAVVSFAGQARVDSGYVDVSGGAGGLPATINGVYGSVGGGTNWAGAFDATAGLGGADAAIMVTDGNPTSPNEPLGPVEEGVTAANLVKAGGTHVYAIGIGGASNLPLIGDAIPGGVGELQTILVNLAMEFCSGALQVVKTSTVDPAARLAGAQFKLQERQGEVPTWVDTLGTCTTDASGACTFGELAVGTEYRVVEVSPPAGYDLPAQRRQLVSIAGGETTTLTFADPPLPPPPPPPPPPPDDIIVTTPVGTVTVPTPTPPGPVGPRSLT